MRLIESGSSVLLLAVVALSTPCLAAAAALDSVRIGESIVLPHIDPSKGAASTTALTLTRVDPYDSKAKLYRIDSRGTTREIPRSRQRFFVTGTRGLTDRSYFVLSPDGKQFQSVTFGAEGARRFDGLVGKTSLTVTRRHPVASLQQQEFSCAVEGQRFAGQAPGGDDAIQTQPRSKVAMYRAVVAVDTDSELLSAKFANNTTSASNYLAELFVGMNVFYERDVDVRLMQGDTFLRVGSDPYVQSDPENQLDEVGGHWKDTPALASINRAFVVFLSGKNPSPNASSGVAWLITGGNYCTAKGEDIGGGQVFGHYSVSQVFKFNGSTAANDVDLVGHELGHNFGAAHTHCTSLAGMQPSSSSTIDQCFNGEAVLGCYGGAPACPIDNSVAGRGSIMSYCNFGPSAGAGCGPVLREFHPVHQAVLDARVTTNVLNGCLASLVLPPPNRVFCHGFEDGACSP